MTLPEACTAFRRKAVWGPKRTLGIAAAFVLSIGFAPGAQAAGHVQPKPRHAHAGPKAKAGKPNSLVKKYKLDGELTKRSGGKNTTATTRVIVELVKGATLPPEFARYARKNGRLNIINGQVVDLPNGVLKQMAA